MTQKKFSQMPTKKLQALLATASDEDKVAIQAIIDKRNAVSKPAAAAETSLSEEEQKAVDAATNDSAATAKPSRKKAPQLTNEQRMALAESMRAEALHHKCEVVPFNTCEWVPGVIVGIIEEKRNNKCLYAIKTDDGRRVVKAYGSDLVKIFDEVVEPVKKERKSRVKLDENGNPIPSNSSELGEWLPEEIEAAINEVIANVGKTITYPKAGAMGVKLEGEESGRIVSLVPNKRQHTILYRIEVDQEDSEAPKKYAHKVTSNEDLKIADELDEVGAKINEAFVKRHNGEHKPRVAKTPAEALEYAKAMLEKANLQLEKAKVNAGKKLEAFKLAQEIFEKSQKNNGTESSEAENAEASAEDDLM